MLTVVTALSLLAGVGACRRADEGGKPTTMNPASSEVMGNTAGATGTPGQSDAAKRAQGEDRAQGAAGTASAATAVGRAARAAGASY
jgi:hypothetical protein